MDYKNRIEEAENFLKQVRARQSELEKELKEVSNAEQQVLGRLTTYREVQEESEKPVSPEPVAGEVLDPGQ